MATRISLPALLLAPLLTAACATIPPREPLAPPVPPSPSQSQSQSQSPLPAMTISSPAFAHNTRIPSIYTCDGKDISPPLSFGSVPAGTKSLVLISDDPDAPVGLWVHWLLWNIGPTTTEIAEDSIPAGAIEGPALSAVEGTTSWGRTGYGGPCPPSGEHRYFFKLSALDVTLDLPATTDKRRLEQAMKGRVLDSAELIGLYSRQ